MRVCIDTNALVQLFGTATPFGRIADALQRGRLEVAVGAEVHREMSLKLTSDQVCRVEVAIRRQVADAPRKPSAGPLIEGL